MPAFATVDDMSCTEHLTKRYDNRTVVHDLNLSTASGRLFGPSRRVSCRSRKGCWAAVDDLRVVDEGSTRPRVRELATGPWPNPAGGVALDGQTGRSREA